RFSIPRRGSPARLRRARACREILLFSLLPARAASSASETSASATESAKSSSASTGRPAAAATSAKPHRNENRPPSTRGIAIPPELSHDSRDDAQHDEEDDKK